VLCCVSVSTVDTRYECYACGFRPSPILLIINDMADTVWENVVITVAICFIESKVIWFWMWERYATSFWVICLWNVK